MRIDLDTSPFEGAVVVKVFFCSSSTSSGRCGHARSCGPGIHAGLNGPDVQSALRKTGSAILRIRAPSDKPHLMMHAEASMSE